MLLQLSFSSNAQFELNGSATHDGTGNYLLTPASGGKVGSIWYEDKISLNESFALDFELYFGTKNNGADGITFCLQPLSTTVGVFGGGLGVGGVKPSFFAEFDTYRNGGDPNYDHVAIQKNGDVKNTSANNLAPAVQIKNGVDNVENGQWYPMQVRWDAVAKKFDIFVDCELRVSYTGDIVNSIFNGDPMVYWGFTASTGGANNEHRVRNVRTDIIKLGDQKICKYENIQLMLPPTASSFSWNPTTGIDNTLSLTPVFSPTKTTEYIVSYSGFCNSALTDTVKIEVDNCNSPDTFYICKGTSVAIQNQDQTNITWNGTEPFTETNGNTINATPSKSTLYTSTSYTKKQNTLINGDFEQPFTNTFKVINDATVNGWSTTAADKKIEFWNDGFLGVPAYNGKQFIELNANMPSALYQDMNTTPGEKLMWGFAHRGRGGVETMNFEVGPPGGPYTNIETVSTGKSWELYSGVYEVPAGQTTTRFYYTSAMPGASGNLLDAIEFYTTEETIDSFVVIVNEIDDVNLGNDTSICLGHSITLDAGTSSGTYIWSTNENSKTIDVSTSGTYNLEVTSAENCKVQSSISVEVVPCKTDFFTTDTIEICEGETATIIGDGITVETWWSDQPFNQIDKSTITTSPKTGYFLYFVGYSPEYADSVLVVVHENPIVSIGNDTTICEGEELTLTSNLIGAYDWSSGSNDQSIIVNSNETFNLKFTDSNGCKGEDSINLTISPLPDFNLGNDTTICEGESVVLQVETSGLNYIWSTGSVSQEITIDAENIYSVTASNNIGCNSTDSISLMINQLPIVNLGADTTICEYQSLLLDANNSGMNFIWNTGATTQKITVTKEGLYSVEVRDEIGCLGSNEIMVSKSIISDPFSDKDKIICEGDTIILQPDPGYENYNISWFSSPNSPLLNVSETGIYSSLVTNEFCKDTFEINVTKIDTPDAVIIDLHGLNNYCFDHDYTTLGIESNENNLTIDWINSGRSDELEITAPGIYITEVSNEYCSAIYQKEIIEYCTGNIYIPNAFTPNDDNVNDIFLPLSNEHINDYEFRVFNRWGDLLFMTNDIGKGWNGKVNNKTVQVDVYVYKITYSYTSPYDGLVKEEKIGRVTLLN